MGKNLLKILALIVILVYLGKLLFSTYKGREETAVVTYGNVVIDFETEAFVVKDEMIIKAPFDGKVEKLAKEGERYSKGEPIFRIYSSSFEEDKLNMLKKVEEKLKEQDFDIPFYQDVKKIDDMIKKEEKNYNEMLKQDEKSAQKILARIEVLKAKKEEILNKAPSVLRTVENLREQKEYLEKYISENSTTVNAPEAGIISFTFDGSERVLNSKNMFNLNVSHLSTVNFDIKKVEGIVKEGDFVCKVVDNFDWYLALILSEEQAGLLKEGSNVKIFISDYPAELRGKIIKIYKGDDKLYVGIVKMIDIYPEFYKKAKIKVKVVLKEYWGMKLPFSAVVTENGEKGVWVLGISSKPVFKKIDIEGTDGRYVILKGVKIYDKVLIPKKGRGD
ncbi:MAG: HlyD family efflux transporter periplasmic adaptor subunit [Caldanaerobacter sp.]